jgi:glycosyltransferase involved in cell wall biosynthesis
MNETPSSLRVAIFGESYLPYLSGVTISTESLARGLTQAGEEVLLVVPRPADEPAASDVGSFAWLPSVQAPPPAPAGYRVPLPVPSTALRKVRTFAPDVIHAQSPFVSGLMARRLSRALGVPLVFTHHTRFGDYRHYLGPLANTGAALMSAYLSRFWLGCAAVIAPGSELAAEIAAAVATHRRRPIVRAIPTGLDLEWIAAIPQGHPRREAGWTPGVDFVVASLGRLAREKSVDILLDAFRQAAIERPELRFLLIGGGPMEELARDQGQHGDLGGRLFVAGRRSRAEGLGLLKACEIFAFASRTETQGLVLAEALAAGVPVVSLAGPGVADSVRDGTDGVIVPREPESMAAARLGGAIAALAADPDRRRQMAHAARDGAKRFALERRIGEVVDLYREAIALG